MTSGSGGGFVSYHLTESLEFLGEIHGETAAGFHQSRLLWNIGTRIVLSNLNTLLISLGRGIRGAPRSEPDVQGYMGLQFNF